MKVIEMSFYTVAFLSYFSAIVFAQGATEIMTGNAHGLSLKEMGVAGTVAALCIMATVHMFKAYRAVQDQRINDLKETDKHREEEVRTLKNMMEQEINGRTQLLANLQKMVEQVDNMQKHYEQK